MSLRYLHHYNLSRRLAVNDQASVIVFDKDGTGFATTHHGSTMYRHISSTSTKEWLRKFIPSCPPTEY